MTVQFVGEEILLNTTAGDSVWSPRMTPLDGGGFVVVWNSIEGLASGEIRARLFGDDGMALGPDFLVNTTSANSQESPEIKGLPGGGFVAAWMSSEDVGAIRARIFGADGLAAEPDFQINTTAGNGSSSPQITALADGGFVVAWESTDGDMDVRARVHAADGTPLGPEFLVSETATTRNQYLPKTIALTDGGFVVAWATDQNADENEIWARVFAADGSTTGPDLQVSTSVTGLYHHGQQITALSDGGFMVTWSSFDSVGGAREVHARAYAADGTAGSPDFMVNTTTGGDLGGPQITVLANGGLVVSWYSYEGDSALEVRARLFSANGTPVGDDFLVNSTTANHQGGAQIAALADGGFAVTWISETPGASEIYARIFGADGTAASSDFRVNSTTEGKQTEPQIVTLPDGQVGIVWYSEGDLGGGYEVRAQIIRTNAQNESPTIVSDGGGFAASVSIAENGTMVTRVTATDPDLNQPLIYEITGGVDSTLFQINDNGELSFIAPPDFENPTDTGADNVYDVTVQVADGDGGVDAQDIAVTVANFNGSDEFRVSTTTYGTQYLSSVAALEDGGFVVTWTTQNNPRDAYAQRFAADGEALGEEVHFSGTTGANVVGLTTGGYVIVLIGIGGDLIGQHYGADGLSVGSEFQINTYTQGLQNWPSISSFNDGGFIVTWRSPDQDGSSGGIYGQRFDENALPVGSEFQVNTYTEGAQLDEAIATFSDRSFVIAWTSSNQDGSGRGVYGQLFNSDGTPRGDEFAINSSTDGDQQMPSIAVLADGGYVVTWSSRLVDGSEPGIYGQRYQVDGTPVGGEFQIHENNDLFLRRYPTVAALDDGGFFVSWSSFGQDESGYGYYGRQFGANGEPVGGEFLINVSTEGDQRHESDRSGNGIAVLTSGNLVATWHGSPRLTDEDGTVGDEIYARIIDLSPNSENEPPVAPPTNAVEIEEDTASALVSIGATDNDADQLEYAVKTGQEPGKGVVQFVGDAFIYTPDPDANGVDSFTIVIEDGNGSSAEQVVSVTIAAIDDAPENLSIDGTTIEENATAGTVVGTLSATDVDAGDNLIYSLLDDAGGLFAIDGSYLVVADGAVLDHEQNGSHQLVLEVTDSSGLTTSEIVTISVLDVSEAPSDIFVAGGSVVENAGEGVVVATLQAIDPDAADSFVFEIVGDDPGLFEIVGDQIRVAAGAQIDFESTASHELTIRVTDSGGNSYEEAVVVSVTNIAPVIIGNSSANSLPGTSEEDQIFGRAGNDTLSGLEGDDRLFGEAGNDRLIGGAGADTLDGGLNNDTYVLAGAEDVVNDIIVEAVGGGVDTVEAGASFMLAANVENLILTGSNDLSGAGNETNNVITGNAGNNVIDGGLGADTMTGGLGNDVYYVDVAGDRVVEGSGGGLDEIRVRLSTFSLNGLGNVENLTFTGLGAFVGVGNALANTITAGDGDDTLDGAGGADTLIGGDGNDTYIVNNVGDLAVELDDEGDADEVRSSVSYQLGEFVENLLLTGGGALSGTGNSLGNSLTGNTGNNVLDGGLGADTMIGGAGNDTYVVDGLGDVIVEQLAQGTDTARTALGEYDLELAANVENLTFIGDGNFIGHGNELVNTLTGGANDDVLFGQAGADTLTANAGNDILDGGTDGDTMRGGDGDDTYYVDNAADRAIESASQGNDTVISTINFTLGANVENLTLAGSATSGTGNGLANLLTGSEGAETLSGGAGADRLVGNGGEDTLLGGSGADTLIGGAGRDTMSGNGDADTFVFNTATDSPTGAQMDTITDFQDSGADRIDLTAMFDGILAYRHDSSFDGIGQVRIGDVVGPDVVVQVNLDENFGTSELEILLAGTTLSAMNAGDFIL